MASESSTLMPLRSSVAQVAGRQRAHAAAKGKTYLQTKVGAVIQSRSGRYAQTGHDLGCNSLFQPFGKTPSFQTAGSCPSYNQSCLRLLITLFGFFTLLATLNDEQRASRDASRRIGAHPGWGWVGQDPCSNYAHCLVVSERTGHAVQHPGCDIYQQGGQNAGAPDGHAAINAHGMWIGTFHGLCNRFLRAHHKLANLPASFQILDTQDQLSPIKRLCKQTRSMTNAIQPSN